MYSHFPEVLELWHTQASKNYFWQRTCNISPASWGSLRTVLQKLNAWAVHNGLVYVGCSVLSEKGTLHRPSGISKINPCPHRNVECNVISSFLCWLCGWLTGWYTNSLTDKTMQCFPSELNNKAGYQKVPCFYNRRSLTKTFTKSASRF